ncbi:MAG: hypothetical protein IKW21_00460 [Lachnospiraceae bacterium]|nr:hypothetical protein [Lachnospiraceae bacterium]
MSRTEYKNQKNKELYEQILLNVPKGTKDKLKSISSTVGISVSEYINRLIKADIEKDHKSEDMVTMLNRWEVKSKYHPMIQEASFLPTTGYYIRLKKGFINDHFNSDEILCRTTKDIRHIMQYTHQIRSAEEMCGFDSKTYEQLLRWQVPKCYFKDIKYIGDHQIYFKDGSVLEFKSVSELRYMWKQRKEG